MCHPLWHPSPLPHCLTHKVVGGIHGNEQACPEVLLRFVHHLASSYGRCRRVTALLDSTDIYVLPVSEFSASADKDLLCTPMMQMAVVQQQSPSLRTPPGTVLDCGGGRSLLAEGGAPHHLRLAV